MRSCLGVGGPVGGRGQVGQFILSRSCIVGSSTSLLVYMSGMLMQGFDEDFEVWFLVVWW